MACSKYTLTNTGTTITTFNYRRCDDSMWQYQVELLPNQTKNIWLIDNTYSLSSFYVNNIVLVNDGVFPPIPITPTPTITNTSTPTPTPTITPTASQTFFVTYSLGFDASSAGTACSEFGSPQLYYSAYIDRPQPNIGEYLYDDNTLTTPSGNGYYSNGVAWWQITGGAGLITSTDPNGC